ncbi:MAG: O-fucosyltransferase family protein [Lachnospiraceae bacterium]|nr:O-fucosyltransferase family protein [Lachnospiraceae bacterium]
MKYCKRVAGRDGLSMNCESYGELNKDKVLYVIRNGKSGYGFFALYRETLKYLAFADRFNLVPVIVWDRNIPYAEDEPIIEKMNPFEYYFQQPVGITEEEALKSYNVILAEEAHITDSFLDVENNGNGSGYKINAIFINQLARIARKYIVMNDTLNNELNREINEVLEGRRTIGVHIRGTDYKQNYNNHPMYVSEEEYIQAIDDLIKKQHYEQIFLATDDQDILNYMIMRYGKKIIYYNDVKRVSGTESVAFSEDNRKNNKYKLGVEVLRDMLTLSYCDAIVSGVSQVSICAKITKLSRNEKYCDEVELYHGVNKNNKIFVK